MKKAICCWILSFCLFPYWSPAQEVLTREEAARIMLENNFGIKIAQRQVELAENNTSRELNGYVPVIDVAAGPTASFGGSTQKFSSGMSAEVRNAFSWTAGASASAFYTLYDQERDYRMDQLKEIVDLTSLQKRLTIENSLFQLYNQYFFVAQLTENLRSLEETLEVSQKRLERTQIRYELSQGLRLDVLNAQVDIDRDSVNLYNVKLQLDNAKRNLKAIMGVGVDGDFEIDGRVEYLDGITKDQLLEDAKTHNVNLLISDQNQIVNEAEIKIIDAGRKPKINSNGGFSYNYQGNAPESFITSSSSTALSAGVSLSWNIFDGGRRKALEQNTRIAIDSEKLLKEQILLELERDISNAWAAYENALFVLEVERKSLETNQLNLQRTEDLYNRGQVTSVEFRQAQLNLLNSETGYNAARYDVKLIEIELLYLSGKILSPE